MFARRTFALSSIRIARRGLRSRVSRGSFRADSGSVSLKRR